MASVKASLAIPAYCFVILPTGSSLSPLADKSSNGKSQVQHTPEQGQHGPFKKLGVFKYIVQPTVNLVTLKFK